MSANDSFKAIGIDIAFDLTRTLYDHGYPYLAITLHTGGRYGLITLWDAETEISRVIVCADIKYDPKAREFLDRYVSEHDNEIENPCGLVGHIAQPAATDPNAFVLTEWIWKAAEDVK